MVSKLHHSHDKLFRETWSNLSNARSFLENYLPENILQITRMDSLEICKDSFIEKVSNTLSEEKGDIIMTLAEKLRNEGLEQGLGQGLLEGIEFAVNIKFGEADDCKSVIAKIRNIQDINRLKALKGKILSAKTIPELIKSIDA